MTEHLPPGALLRDPRTPDALDLRVSSSDAEFVVVSTAGTSRRYKRKEARFYRWRLPARTAVEILPTASYEKVRAGVVVSVFGDAPVADSWTYVVQTDAGEEYLSEVRLRVLKLELDDPVARIELNAWRGPKRFFARLGLLERTTIWKQDSEGIPAFLGARIEPLFHQIYAARRCLLDREPRFLLADEVGLGKTIEAGLVIQSLLAAKADLRVLVVSPGTTSRQWLSELYYRFGGRVFAHIDAVRYDPAPRAQREMSGLLSSDLLIVTTSLLRTQSRALATIASQTWDLLVVDEGHHLANWPDLLVQLRRVSAAASGCLVLSATPGRGDDRGLLEMLKLVAPKTYGHVTDTEFARRLDPQRRIAEKLLYSEELVAALLACGDIGVDDARSLASQWQGLFPDDPVVTERLTKMEDGDGEAAEELVAHVQEHYRVDRRIIRTRRRTLGEYGSRYATRTIDVLEYEPTPAEVAVADQVAELLARPDVPAIWKGFWSRHACTTPSLLLQQLQKRIAAMRSEHADANTSDPLAADLGPAEEEAALDSYLLRGPTFAGEEVWLHETQAQVERWFAAEGQAPQRFAAVRRWLSPRIRAGSWKTIVFCQSRPMVEELAAHLAASFGAEAVAVMTHTLPDDEIAEVARRFERRTACLVLVSDEVGAEGRNFQFADAVVHLDQPSVVSRLEQRIGRLDRIGRRLDRPVLSVVISGPVELERAFLELHRDIFQVYVGSIGGLEYLLPYFQELIQTAAAEGAQALRALSETLQPRIAAAEKEVDEAFSFFLDATRPDLERAKELAELVAERTGEEDETFVRQWCKELRIDVVPQEDSCVKVEVRTERIETPLRILGGRDWVKVGTFLREVALDVPAVQYLAPGHQLIDALLGSAAETHDARATAFFRDLGVHCKGRVFCVVVDRLGPDTTAYEGGLPAGLLRRAEHYLPCEWVRSVFEILPDGDISPVSAGPLAERLLRDLQPGDRKCHPDHLSQIVERYPGLWAGLRAAVSAARSAVLGHKADEIGAAAREFEDALRTELAYLRTQRGRQATGDEDADRALREREALLASVRAPAVATDAVALLIGSDAR